MKRLDEGLEVGGMKFREPPENKDSFYKRRTARDKEGNFTYISKASNGMNYNNPVKKNGEPRRYFQFLMEIVANPGITRKEILKKVYGDEHKLPDWDDVNKRVKDMAADNPHITWFEADRKATEDSKAEGYGRTTYEARGYMNTYFAGLHADGFIRVTTKGEIFPTAKCSNFVNEYLDEVDPSFIPEELADNRLEENKKLKGKGSMRTYREAKGLTPEQEERCINEAAFYVDVREVPTVQEVLELFNDDEWYIDFFGANQIAAARRIVELSKMDYNEFFERYHNVLEDSTIVDDYYDSLEAESFEENTRTTKRRVRESSAPSDVIDALHELKRAIKQYKNRQSILDYVINDLTEAFL
jgi:hypothetical protein